MKTIKIADFTSNESLVEIGKQIQENRIENLEGKTGIERAQAGQFYNPFQIICENKTWSCQTIGNGTPFDCWIFKKGTQGATSKTFKRVSAVRPL